MKKYWLLNVAGVGGYSIMVHCEANTIEEADDYSIKHFKENNLIHEL
jgi:hypothetical protein